MLNTLSSVSVRESRFQYLCDPQWFRDTASRGPTTIAAPESQFWACPSDHAESTLVKVTVAPAGGIGISRYGDISVTREDLLALVRIEVAAGRHRARCICAGSGNASYWSSKLLR
ncbi:hypothetical protein F511_11562 [Dorcoceras hygrometricum]|uniref:Uncharacterized protein n=1 Tax=Dorcoceras hygrometricum TaxID=472368 RepID=A0A2Z7CWS7_9LAMI|nr:hypothetical protein F511_11562 [Dorcoceras hygrometricum]